MQEYFKYKIVNITKYKIQNAKIKLMYILLPKDELLVPIWIYQRKKILKK